MGDVVTLTRRRVNGPWHQSKPAEKARRPLPPANTAEIRRLHQLGRTITEIAALLRTPYREVMRVIDEA